MCTGRACAPLEMYAVACGISSAFTIEPNTKVAVSMPCFDSFSVEFTVPAQQFTLSSGPCERCYAEVCFENSTVSVTTCFRPVPVKWTLVPLLPEYECIGLAPRRFDLVPVEWEYRRFVTSTQDQGSLVTIVRRCEPYRCDGCPDPASQDQGFSAGALISQSPNAMRTKCVRFYLPEDHDSGNLRELTELRVDQIRHLAATLSAALSPADLEHPSMTMIEVISGDHTLPFGQLDVFKEKLDSLISAKLGSPATYDLDGDGQAAPDDALAFFDAQRKAENGEPWDRRVDLNGDGTPSLEDLCFLVSYIYR
ncbi:MAG: hypothetical protein ACK4WH_10915 [Phycisphaerales bacterium]